MEIQGMMEIRGLSEAEARMRRQRGQGNDIRLRTSRSYGEIVRQNVFAFINIVLFSIGAILIAIGRVEDAIVSVVIILMNVVIGVFQEIRAKRQLDRIALLTRPKISMIRDGMEKVVDPSEIVLGDILIARPGDQIVVDGEVMGNGSIEVDESLLTGESDLISKDCGDEVLSGSFCVTGSTHYEAKKVGKESYINRLTADARKFRIVQTPLQKDVDFIIRLLTLLAIFIGLLLLISAILLAIPFMRSVQMAAVIAGLVPNGLFLMLVVAYAMGAVRIVRSGALVQQSNSVESLSYVNMLCLDKTGTLTTNQIRLNGILPIGMEEDSLKSILGDFASSASAVNRTTEAIRVGLEGRRRDVKEEVPFSSERRWSGLIFENPDLKGAYILGAIETLLPHLMVEPNIEDQIEKWVEAGLRVLMFAFNPDISTLFRRDKSTFLPHDLKPLGLLSFRDELRSGMKETIRGFAAAGIHLKVISGDHPETVASLAKQAGLPCDVDLIASGIQLEQMDETAFEKIVEERTIFGRISPSMKEKMVGILRRLGYYVAMIGDGVNDVLSLKKANLGIAMQSGSAATRSVADMVLLGDSFGALPLAFLEGQRIINGMKDILRLFLTRAIYFALLILSTAVIGIGFPYVPKHATLVTLFSVGIPTLALAAWARPGNVPKRSIIRSILHFVIPASLSVFLFGLFVYTIAFGYALNQVETDAFPVSQEEIDRFRSSAGIDYPIESSQDYFKEEAILVAQTALTTFTLVAGLILIIFVEPPVSYFVAGDELSGDKRPTGLALILILVFILVLVLAPLRNFFELLILPFGAYLLIAVTVVCWMMVLRLAWKARWIERFLQLDIEGFRNRS
jgi:cation-transporting ATPase E